MIKTIHNQLYINFIGVELQILKSLYPMFDQKIVEIEI